MKFVLATVKISARDLQQRLGSQKITDMLMKEPGEKWPSQDEILSSWVGKVKLSWMHSEMQNHKKLAENMTGSTGIII